MFFVTTNFLVTPLLKRCVWLGSFCETVPGVALIEEKCLQMMLCSNNQCAGWVRHCQPMSSLSSRLVGLGVWFSLWVREVPGSNPGWALVFAVPAKVCSRGHTDLNHGPIGLQPIALPLSYIPKWCYILHCLSHLCWHWLTKRLLRGSPGGVCRCAKYAVTRIRTWVTAATTQGPNH